MKKYIISEIYTDGYERVAIIEEVGKDEKIAVHFLEYDEYLANNEKSQKKGKGDMLEGDISIDLITFSQKTNESLIHRQERQKSPHIEAIIEVAQIVDEYSVYALSSISDENILIEFENAVNYKIGERIFVIGSLELSEVT